MIQTAEDKVKEYCQCIHREIEHWKDINQNGCSDPLTYMPVPSEVRFTFPSITRFYKTEEGQRIIKNEMEKGEKCK